MSVASEGAVDGETGALAAIGRAAQECHAKHLPSASGKLVLRLKLSSSGSVAGAEVDRASSEKALTHPAFERCVLEAARRQTLPAPSGDDVQLELPLAFEPVP